MQSFCRRIRLVATNTLKTASFFYSTSSRSYSLNNGSRFASFQPNSSPLLPRSILSQFLLTQNYGSLTEALIPCKSNGILSVTSLSRDSRHALIFRAALVPPFPIRHISTQGSLDTSNPQAASASGSEVAPRIKFKRLDKTARHIMQIIDKEAVEEVKTQREIPEIKPGYIIQLKLEVPENKRRVSTVKGIVIARRNAGLNTTIRLRRLVAGVGVESLLPLYSPNIKEIKVLDKKKVRRAKLYYLRDKMNALKKQ